MKKLIVTLAAAMALVFAGGAYAALPSVSNVTLSTTTAQVGDTVTISWDGHGDNPDVGGYQSAEACFTWDYSYSFGGGDSAGSGGGDLCTDPIAGPDLTGSLHVDLPITADMLGATVVGDVHATFIACVTGSPCWTDIPGSSFGGTQLPLTADQVDFQFGVFPPEPRTLEDWSAAISTSGGDPTVECGATANTHVNITYAVRFPNGTPGIDIGQPPFAPRFALTYPGGTISSIGAFALPIGQTHFDNGDVVFIYTYDVLLDMPVTECDQPFLVTVDQQQTDMPQAHAEALWTVTTPIPPVTPDPTPAGTSGGGSQPPAPLVTTPAPITAPVVAPVVKKVVYSLTAVRKGTMIKIRSSQATAQTLCFFRHGKKRCVSGTGSWNLTVVKGDGLGGKQYLSLLDGGKVVARTVVKLAG
jgi:hypothetical protein